MEFDDYHHIVWCTIGVGCSSQNQASAKTQPPQTPQNQRKKDKNRVHAPVETQNLPIEWVALEQAENRICAKTCGLFPPCLPLIFRGERIEKEKLQKLQSAKGVFGIENGKIAVLQGDKR